MQWESFAPLILSRHRVKITRPKNVNYYTLYTLNKWLEQMALIRAVVNCTLISPCRLLLRFKLRLLQVGILSEETGKVSVRSRFLIAHCGVAEVKGDRS